MNGLLTKIGKLSLQARMMILVGVLGLWWALFVPTEHHPSRVNTVPSAPIRQTEKSSPPTPVGSETADSRPASPQPVLIAPKRSKSTTPIAVVDARDTPPRTLSSEPPATSTQPLASSSTLAPPEPVSQQPAVPITIPVPIISPSASPTNSVSRPASDRENLSSDLRRNLSACMNGYLSCNKNLLTEQEREQVHASDLRRNLNACMNGYLSCNKNLLTPDQLVEVQARQARRRN